MSDPSLRHSGTGPHNLGEEVEILRGQWTFHEQERAKQEKRLDDAINRIEVLESRVRQLERLVPLPEEHCSPGRSAHDNGANAEPGRQSSQQRAAMPSRSLLDVHSLRQPPLPAPTPGTKLMQTATDVAPGLMHQPSSASAAGALLNRARHSTAQSCGVPALGAWPHEVKAFQRAWPHAGGKQAGMPLPRQDIATPGHTGSAAGAHSEIRLMDSGAAQPHAGMYTSPQHNPPSATPQRSHFISPGRVDPTSAQIVSQAPVTGWQGIPHQPVRQPAPAINRLPVVPHQAGPLSSAAARASMRQSAGSAAPDMTNGLLVPPHHTGQLLAEAAQTPLRQSAGSAAPASMHDLRSPKRPHSNPDQPGNNAPDSQLSSPSKQHKVAESAPTFEQLLQSFRSQRNAQQACVQSLGQCLKSKLLDFEMPQAPPAAQEHGQGKQVPGNLDPPGVQEATKQEQSIAALRRSLQMHPQLLDNIDVEVNHGNRCDTCAMAIICLPFR